MNRRPARAPRPTRRGLKPLMILLMAASLCARAPVCALAQEGSPEGAPAPARLAILPFAISGALEYESVGPFVPDMLASRMSDLGRFRFVDTTEMRQGGGGSASGTLTPDEAARLADRFGAEYVIAGAIRRSGGVTVMSAQAYAEDGSDAGERVVVPVVTLEDLLPKMEPLAEALAARLRPPEAAGGTGTP